MGQETSVLHGHFFGRGNSIFRDVPVGPGENHSPRTEHVIDPILKTMLAEWTDWDVAQFLLGVSLGIFTGTTHNWYHNAKGLMWTNNPMGEFLATMLQNMMKAGILEYREEPDQRYRWAKEKQ